MKTKELLGYSTVRSFGGYALPVPIQTQLLRTYCSDKNYIYKLSTVESYIKNNYMFLNTLIEEAPNQGDIGMCSVFMLPQKNKFEDMQKKIETKCLNFHFIFENSVVNYSDLWNFYMNSRLRFIQDNESYKIEDLIKSME
tara:strand:- start:2016 stop:2435 length:420 start_codon:yes stop_codon:yes gene_type:complete